MPPFRFIAASLLLQSAIVYSSSAPAPVAIDFGDRFFGTDGQWSAAQIRVGTPEQWVSVFPSTTAPDSWVVGPAGCTGSGAQDCIAFRGGVFYSSNSTSYQRLGQYDLVQNRLGYKNNYGDYGSDRLAISDKIAAADQTIATVVDPQFFLGQLGLGNQRPRFDDRINRLPLIATLRQNYSVIPSNSFGYTAGAVYAQKKVPGSLVLGGYDSTRFTPNNVQFQLSPDYYPNVAITSITVGVSNKLGSDYPPGWTYNPQTLLQPGSAGIYTIDSSTPFLWLPPAVCDNFAQVLNLTYDVNLQLYRYSNNVTDSATVLQRLKDWGITFTFSLANKADESTGHIDIPISFNAFNLQLTYGYPGISNTSDVINYFPLRRANVTTQYTIGRAFLQESYLMVDYERNQFSVAPALFPDVIGTPQNLVAVYPPSNGGLSTGAKAGIAIVMVLLAVAIAVGIWFFLRRRKRAQRLRQQQQIVEAPASNSWVKQDTSKSPHVSVAPMTELLADRRQPSEMLVDSANTRFELPGNTAIEMPAAEVHPAYLSANQAADGTVMVTNDQVAELGLQNHPSIRKDYNLKSPTEGSQSPSLPPYSPADVGRVPTAGIEEMTQRPSRPTTAYGTHSSSGAGVSPLGGYGSPANTDGIMSPVSPEMRPSQGYSPNGASSGTQTTAGVSQPNKISRTVSHNSRFKEDLGDGRKPIPETEEETKPDASTSTSRYSWEQ